MTNEIMHEIAREEIVKMLYTLRDASFGHVVSGYFLEVADHIAPKPTHRPTAIDIVREWEALCAPNGNLVDAIEAALDEAASQGAHS